MFIECRPRTRSANGSGPDNTPPTRVIVPDGPHFNESSAGSVRLSIATPIAVSMAAAPIAIRFNARSRCPINSRIDTAPPSPDAPKWIGSSETFRDQTGTAVAPMSTPV